MLNGGDGGLHGPSPSLQAAGVCSPPRQINDLFTLMHLEAGELQGGADGGKKREKQKDKS